MGARPAQSAQRHPRDGAAQPSGPLYRPSDAFPDPASRFQPEGPHGPSQIIDPAALDADGRIVFAATVELEDLDTGAAVTYQIVGDDEADLEHGLISVSSPIARALIGKSEGDVASVQAPSGVRQYEIISVRYI